VQRSGVRYHLMLADSAQAVGGKLFVLGGAVQTTITRPAPLAICGTIIIPWDETNTPHTLTVLLESTAGQAIMVPTPMGDQPFRIEANFEGGRPPGAPKGTEFTTPIAMNILRPQLPAGRYVFKILSDDVEVDALPLDVFDELPQPQGI
jgi:hypothetical protein